MRLPEKLREAIHQETAQFDARVLSRATADLARHYKGESVAALAFRTARDRAAYLAARLPATFAAVSRVFTEIRKLAPDVEINSILDLGSGPGTAVWAAAAAFAGIERAMLIEADQEWIEVGRRLAEQSADPALRQAQWLRHDLRNPEDWSQHDLITVSYALGELSSSTVEVLIPQALRSTAKFLVVIEPGTMKGFGVIHRVRTAVIAAGVGILAPCPHRLACPMAAASDWCHFSQRLERSPLHRRLKSGELGYEDEKFSYLVASKQAAALSGAARIVRHPGKRPGHVQLELCTDQGVERRTITRSQKADYKQARHAEWGGLWAE